MYEVGILGEGGDLDLTNITAIFLASWKDFVQNGTLGDVPVNPQSATVLQIRSGMCSK